MRINQQAQGLQQMASTLKQRLKGDLHNRRAHIIAISSGKGGVGKSNVSLNAAIALQQKGFKVLLIDADLGLANVDILLGSNPKHNLGHVFQGIKSLDEIIYPGPDGLDLIAASSAETDYINVDKVALARFLKDVLHLEKIYDYIIFDTGAGLSPTVTSLLMSAHEVILVITPEPTAITDAYAVIKILSREGFRSSWKVVVNQAQDASEGEDAFQRFNSVTEGFLGISLTLLGIIPRDFAVNRAVMEQRPFVLSYPLAPASVSVWRIAERIVNNQTYSREKKKGLDHLFYRFWQGMKGESQ